MPKSHTHRKGPDGLYHINGSVFKTLVGKRARVWHGTAFKTSGDLRKSDLTMNSRGRIVSKKKSQKAVQGKGSRFKKAGFTLAKKGSFGPVKFLRDKTVSAKRSTKSKSKTARRKTF